MNLAKERHVRMKCGRERLEEKETDTSEERKREKKIKTEALREL